MRFLSFVKTSWLKLLLLYNTLDPVMNWVHRVISFLSSQVLTLDTCFFLPLVNSHDSRQQQRRKIKKAVSIFFSIHSPRVPLIVTSKWLACVRFLVSLQCARAASQMRGVKAPSAKLYRSCHGHYHVIGVCSHPKRHNQEERAHNPLRTSRISPKMSAMFMKITQSYFA